ncbi:MAG: hypothetical protein V1903_04665 [Bacteroidota bacterium]
MARYILSSKPLSTGIHVVHRSGCPLAQGKVRGINLSGCKNADEAVTESIKFFRKVGICPFCMKQHQLHPPGIMNLKPEPVSYTASFRNILSAPENVLTSCRN